jgi:hypothetical protein
MPDGVSPEGTKPPAEVVKEDVHELNKPQVAVAPETAAIKESTAEIAAKYRKIFADMEPPDEFGYVIVRKEYLGKGIELAQMRNEIWGKINQLMTEKYPQGSYLATETEINRLRTEASPLDQVLGEQISRVIEKVDDGVVRDAATSWLVEGKPGSMEYKFKSMVRRATPVDILRMDLHGETYKGVFSHENFSNNADMAQDLLMRQSVSTNHKFTNDSFDSLPPVPKH